MPFEIKLLYGILFSVIVGLMIIFPEINEPFHWAAIMMMMVPVTLVALFPVLVAVLTRRAVYLRIVFYLYLAGSIVLSGYAVYRYINVSLLTTVPATAISPPPNNIQTIEFKPNYTGEADLAITVDQSIMEKIYNACPLFTKNNLDPSVKARCYENYSAEKNVKVTVNGAKVSPFGYFISSDYNFPVEKNKTYQIVVTLEYNKTLLDMLTVNPFVTVRAPDIIYMQAYQIFVYSIPVVFSAVMMLFYMRRLLRVRSQHN